MAAGAMTERMFGGYRTSVLRVKPPQDFSPKRGSRRSRRLGSREDGRKGRGVSPRKKPYASAPCPNHPQPGFQATAPCEAPRTFRIGIGSTRSQATGIDGFPASGEQNNLAD